MHFASWSEWRQDDRPRPVLRVVRAYYMAFVWLAFPTHMAMDWREHYNHPHWWAPLFGLYGWVPWILLPLGVFVAVAEADAKERADLKRWLAELEDENARLRKQAPLR